MNEDRTEEQIHALPDFQTLEKSMNDHYETVEPFTSVEQFQAYVGRTIDHDAWEHFSGHRVWDLAPMSVPPPIIQLFQSAFMAMWKDGFLAGARFQQIRTHEIASATVPDSLEGLA